MNPKKGITLAVSILFIGLIIAPSTVSIPAEKLPIPFFGSKTLYVGGDGLENYSSIQDAIDDATDGDTVFVFNDSSPYYENVVVDKPITLVGEDKESTIIDGSGKGTVVSIVDDRVAIYGFTVQNSKSDWYSAGIKISHSNGSSISGNTIRNNPGYGIYFYGYRSFNIRIVENTITDNIYGIYMIESSGSIISENAIANNEKGIYIVETYGTVISANTIRNKWSGIHLEKSYNNTVSDNTIMDNADGIYMYNSSGNLFSENTIFDNEWFGIWFTGSSDNIVAKNNISDNDDIGVYLAFSSNNTITENVITGNAHGIYLEYSSSTMIHKNILRNDLNAYFVASLPSHCKNKWNRNYWDRPRFFPSRISGMVKRENIPLFSWVNFDWRPLFVQPIGTMGSVNDGSSSGTFGLGGDTLYVGGDGPGNYSTIQEAIDASNHGDTIYVYSGMYYENIVVDKGITLHGEEKNTTVIDGAGYGDIISIFADHVVVRGFTIANGHFGILIRNASYHRIEGNNISNNLRGISLQGCRSVLITNNTFYYNQYGIRLYSSSSISVRRNNFGGTYKTHAFFTGLFVTQYKNSWCCNYWGSSRLLPYPISGKIIVGKILIHWLAFDWFPARSPYLL